MSPIAGDEMSGVGILRMKEAVTSEEEDTYIQDFNIPTGYSHLARNYLMEIITPAMKAFNHIIIFTDLEMCAAVLMMSLSNESRPS